MLTILVKNHFEQLSYYLSTPFKVEIKLKQKKFIGRDKQSARMTNWELRSCKPISNIPAHGTIRV